MRRATTRQCPQPSFLRHFYPRSPCGERLDKLSAEQQTRAISIHALLAESDYGAGSSRDPARDFYPRSPCGERPPALQIYWLLPLFLSTLSLRRATWGRSRRRRSSRTFLSTLSLRRVTEQSAPPKDRISISIHALLAESDQQTAYFFMCVKAFLSTLSLRRATLIYKD